MDSAFNTCNIVVFDCLKGFYKSIRTSKQVTSINCYNVIQLHFYNLFHIYSSTMLHYIKVHIISCNGELKVTLIFQGKNGDKNLSSNIEYCHIHKHQFFFNQFGFLAIFSLKKILFQELQ